MTFDDSNIKRNNQKFHNIKLKQWAYFKIYLGADKQQIYKT
jgi:hypothetical protein